MNRRKEVGTVKMNAIKRIEELVLAAIDTGDYRLVRKAMDIAEDEEIFMLEADDCVMIEDEVYNFNGAF